MVAIRAYHEQDAPTVGRLIADTYGAFNLSFVPPRERAPFLGPFQHAGSLEAAHQAAIARAIRSQVVL
ncbi:MAG: hypothetical protein PVF47_02010, partial [Anaerolineae bacterium]